MTTVWVGPSFELYMPSIPSTHRQFTGDSLYDFSSQYWLLASTKINLRPACSLTLPHSKHRLHTPQLQHGRYKACLCMVH
jgi:hypothetical protein